MYAAYTDGDVGGWGTGSPNPGQVRIEGGDPLRLSIINLANTFSDGAGYGRYPCGSLMHNGIWYYGTYLLTWTDTVIPQPTADWGVLQPFVGFRTSIDKGKHWIDKTNAATGCLFEPTHHSVGSGHEILIGAPHFVDFGKDNQYAPIDQATGRKYAYMVAHGADTNNVHQNNSWIRGNNTYLLRTLLPAGTDGAANNAYINTASNWQYFAQGNTWRNWTRSNLKDVYTHIQPIAHWENQLGNVSMTYDAPIRKYLMAICRSVDANNFTTIIMESDSITGSFKIVHYLEGFGPRIYFANFPSKFISADGKTLWLFFSANYWWYNPPSFPGCRYSMCVHEVTLTSTVGTTASRDLQKGMRMDIERRGSARSMVVKVGMPRSMRGKKVTLDLFDLRGVKVRSYASNADADGVSAIRVTEQTGSNLKTGSGTYVAKVRCGNSAQTIQLLAP